MATDVLHGYDPSQGVADVVYEEREDVKELTDAELLDEIINAPEPAEQSKGWWDKVKSIKPGSTKPFLITTRDALIVAVVTVLIMLIFLVIYNFVMGTLEVVKTGEFWIGIGKTLVISLFIQYVYEYIGFNVMLAESAIRYGKGSSLEMFKDSRHALTYKWAYTMMMEDVSTVPEDILKKNLRLLITVLDNIREGPLIARYLEKQQIKNRSLESVLDKEIADKINKKKKYITVAEVHTLRHLVQGVSDEVNLDYLNASGRLIEIIDEDITRHILAHGLRDFVAQESWWPGPEKGIQPIGILKAKLGARQRLQALKKADISVQLREFGDDYATILDTKIKSLNAEIKKYALQAKKASSDAGDAGRGFLSGLKLAAVM